MGRLVDIFYGAGVRLIGLSGNIDRAFRLCDLMRSEMVVGFLPDEFLRRYNDFIYAKKDIYRTDSTSFRDGLFEWERNAVEKFFPKPGARVLIGGAGGGREAFALSKMRYEITATEPCGVLFETMRKRAGMEHARIKTIKGAYEEIENWEVEHPFDAVMLGWGSISHVIREETLENLFAILRRKSPNAPVLFSFLRRSSESEGRYSKMEQLSWAIRKISPYKRPAGSSFHVSGGFLRRFTDDEIKQIARSAGYKIVHLCSDVTSYPHAVFK